MISLGIIGSTIISASILNYMIGFCNSSKELAKDVDHESMEQTWWKLKWLHKQIGFDRVTGF